MNIEKDILEPFASGVSCSQVIFGAFASYGNMPCEKASMIGTAFSGGNCGGVCGAYAGALMAISLIYGDEFSHNFGRERVKEISLEFEKRFLKEVSSLYCEKIVGHNLREEEGRKKFEQENCKQRFCIPAVRNAASILKTLISENEPLLKRSYIPLSEYDGDKTAMIEPKALIGDGKLEEICVLCFFGDVVKSMKEKHNAKVAFTINSEMGEHPVYAMEYEGQRVNFVQPGVGAPLAAAILDEVISLGAKHIIACGGAGVLSSSHKLGALLLPNSAIRDEGVSYHYMPASRLIDADESCVDIVRSVLKEEGMSFETIRTWTTDAIYRETPKKVGLRKEEGCEAVEMEAASLFAVSRFRSVNFAQILYAGDCLSEAQWEHRDWNKAHAIRERVFYLAVKSAIKIAKNKQ